MPELGNVNSDDLYPKVVKTLSNKFWIVNCYKKNNIDYLHNLIGQESYNTPMQAMVASGYTVDEVINNYA